MKPVFFNKINFGATARFENGAGNASIVKQTEQEVELAGVKVLDFFASST